MLKATIISYREIMNNNIISAKYWYFTDILMKFLKKHNAKPVNKLGVISSGSYIPKYSEDKTNTTYLRVQNIRNFNLNLNDSDIVYLDKNLYDYDDSIISNIGDILVSRTTSSPSNFGNSIVSDEKYAISQHISKISCSDKKEAYYISAVLNSSIGKLQLVRSCGSTRMELTHEQLGSVIIPYLGKPVRDNIIENYIKAVQLQSKSINIIKKAQEIFRAALNVDFNKIRKEAFYLVNYKELCNQDMWTPAFYYPLYLNTLKAIKKICKTITIRELDIDIKKGDEVGAENYKNYLDKDSDDIPFIRTSDIVNYEVDNYPDYYVSENMFNKINQDVKEGDILFTKDGKISVTAMLLNTNRCILSSGIARLRVKNKISPFYLFIALSLKEIGTYQAYQRTVVASTIPHLHEDRLRDFEIPLLPCKHMDEIDGLVREAFKLKNVVKALIEDIKGTLEKELDIH